jgi:hypothetical protein
MVRRRTIGKVEKTFLVGDLIVNGDEWLDRKGGAKYYKRSTAGVFSAFFHYKFT